jgi:hypothetical protein
MSILLYGYRKNRWKKPIFGVAGVGSDPPASASSLEAADPPETPPPLSPFLFLLLFSLSRSLISLFSDSLGFSQKKRRMQNKKKKKKEMEGKNKIKNKKEMKRKEQV